MTIDFNLNLPNALNGSIHLPFLPLSIIIFRDIKIKEPDTGGKG